MLFTGGVHTPRSPEDAVRFQFDGNQAYQLKAIEAVADLFRGQPRVASTSTPSSWGRFRPVANRLDLDQGQLLANLQAVQKRNALPPDAKLETIEETIRTAGGDAGRPFPQLLRRDGDRDRERPTSISAPPWNCTAAMACGSSSSSCRRSPSAKAC